MRRNTAFAWLFVALGGCAGAPDRHANPVEAALGAGVATDVVTQMATLYPPARTALVLNRPVAGAFGTALLAGLRGRGYAVEETTGHAVSSGEQAFAYVVDPIDGQSLYRVSVTVGGRELSRVYVVDADGAHPGGAWTHRE